jgi:hypothetical protein
VCPHDSTKTVLLFVTDGRLALFVRVLLNGMRPRQLRTPQWPPRALQQPPALSPRAASSHSQHCPHLSQQGGA